jgi:hypothetical protein
MIGQSAKLMRSGGFGQQYLLRPLEDDYASTLMARVHRCIRSGNARHASVFPLRWNSLVETAHLVQVNHLCDSFIQSIEALGTTAVSTGAHLLLARRRTRFGNRPTGTTRFIHRTANYCRANFMRLDWRIARLDCAKLQVSQCSHPDTTTNEFMKHLAVAAALILCSLQAVACPLSDALSTRYGISFSGFKTTIPAATAPDMTDSGSFIRVAVRDNSKVADGFRHTIVMNTRTKQAWVLRTGGFASVYDWFGPVDAHHAPVQNCRSDHMPADLRAL